MKFFDIAFNLNDLMFKGIYNDKVKHENDLEIVLEKAKKNNVDKILCTGTSLTSSENTIKFIREYNGSKNFLFCTVGVHPTECTEFSTTNDVGKYIDELRKLIYDNKDIVKAYGEFGLDKERTNYCNYDVQYKFFELQLQLASHIDLPLFLHNRNADEDFFNLLSKYPKSLLQRGVIHSFSSNEDCAIKALKYNLDISLNGCSLRDDTLHNFIPNIPIDRLHIETDSPWCLIKQTHSSKNYLEWTIADYNAVKPQYYSPNNNCYNFVKGRNEPALIKQVAECVYKIYNNKGKPTLEGYEEFTNNIYMNSINLFQI